jgi:hypothetical protein
MKLVGPYVQGSGHGYCSVRHGGGDAGSATPGPAPANHLWMEASAKLKGQVHEMHAFRGGLLNYVHTFCVSTDDF